MKYVILILLALSCISCSSGKIEIEKNTKFDRFFSISGLSDMKAFDNLGNIEAPFDDVVIKKINENEAWKENLKKVYPDGYWIYDQGKLINGNRVFTVPRNGLALELYIVPFFRDEFVKNHKRLYFRNNLTFNLSEIWLNKISKSDQCEISKNIASLPDSKISIDNLWFPSHEEFIKKYCPSFLSLEEFYVNDLNCKRKQKSTRAYICFWN